MKYIILTITTLLLFTGCMPKDAQPVKKQVTSKEQNTSKVMRKNTLPPPPPKKEIVLKEVEDTNYNDTYMYPQAPEKKENVVQQPASDPIATGNTMGKQACIAMISQEKFDKYTVILGSEAASIKRCNMISAMTR